MKVGIAHYSSNSDISGVTTWLAELCRRLVLSGHKVGLCLHHFGNNPHHASILKDLPKKRLQLYNYHYSGRFNEDKLKTLNFINKYQPDIYLPQCMQAHYGAALIAGQAGLPWIFTMHSDDHEYWNSLHLSRPCLTNGSIVTVSTFIAEELSRRKISLNHHIIPYGTKVSSQKTNWRTDFFRVVYCGRLVNKQKCVLLVVNALIIACRKNPLIVADIIGDGSERYACEKAVQSAGLINRIRFHGRLNNSEVNDVLLNAQAMLLMSEYEGLPIALIEAMSLGVVPVVRWINSGIPELVCNNITGITVNDDPAKAAEAIVQLSVNQQLWHTCSNKAKQHIKENYDVDICYSKWIKLISKRAQNCAARYPIRENNVKVNQVLPSNDYID